MSYQVRHVVPINDTEEHSEVTNNFGGFPMSCLCSCNPTMEFTDDGILFIHNSFGGRENFEPDNDVRKN